MFFYFFLWTQKPRARLNIVSVLESHLSPASYFCVTEKRIISNLKRCTKIACPANVWLDSVSHLEGSTYPTHTHTIQTIHVYVHLIKTKALTDWENLSTQHLHKNEMKNRLHSLQPLLNQMLIKFHLNTKYSGNRVLSPLNAFIQFNADVQTKI